MFPMIWRCAMSDIIRSDTDREFVRLERSGWVATITLSRPPVNALNRQLVSELSGAVAELAADDDASVAIITSDLDHFSAGADLRERAETAQEGVADAVAAISAMVTQIANLPQPTIASIYGAAVGGGAEIALACDLRIMAENGKLGLKETSLGIIPGAGGTVRLARLIGPSRAKSLIYSAELMEAPLCLATGAVNMVVPTNMLRESAIAWAEAFAKNAPLALRAAKQAINGGLGRSMEEGLQAERDAYAALIGTADRDEGIKAFLEKRDPQWQGD